MKENQFNLSDTLLDFILRDHQSIPRALRLAGKDDLTAATVDILINILHNINALPLGRGSFFERCKEAAAKLRTEEEDRKYAKADRGHVRPSEFVALIALNAGTLERRLTPSTPPPAVDLRVAERQLDQDRFELDMHDLIPWAARAVLLIFDPSLHIDAPGVHATIKERKGSEDDSISEKRAIRAWNELDPATFEYWRMGTTSVIIKCSKYAVESAAFSEALILKCVVFPWNLIPTIAEGTLSYADRYKDLDAVVVRAIASSRRWVLMPYQKGPTLAEHFKAQKFDPKTFFNQLAFASKVTLDLAAALDALSNGAALSDIKTEHQHLDLSPSNIIMAPGDTPEEGLKVKFIDLGENYLYTRQIGMADHDDAVYVPPEVKNRGSAPSSDLFSLAVITIELLSGIKARDGKVPDAVYEISPAIGRILDDMLDDDAAKRLLLVPHSEEMRFSDIRRYLGETFDLVKHEPVASKSSFERLWAQWAPASHEVSSLLAKLWDLKDQEGRKELQDQVGYLAFMSLIASAAWWYIFTRCALFHFDDLITGDWMQDAPAYVIGLLVINFAIHYASKCVLAGAAVRGGLARAFATGERLSALTHQEGRLPDSRGRKP